MDSCGGERREMELRELGELVVEWRRPSSYEWSHVLWVESKRSGVTEDRTW